MACSCTTKIVANRRIDSPEIILPEDQCLFCAEKHISTAMQLAREFGYSEINRSKIIGELVLFTWHVHLTHYDLALKATELRHLISMRQEPKTITLYEDLVSAIDDAITAQLSKRI